MKLRFSILLFCGLHLWIQTANANGSRVLLITGLMGLCSSKLEEQAVKRGWTVVSHSNSSEIDSFICANPGATVVGFSLGAEAIKTAQIKECGPKVKKWISIDPPTGVLARQKTSYFLSSGYPLTGGIDSAARVVKKYSKDAHCDMFGTSNEDAGRTPLDDILNEMGYAVEKNINSKTKASPTIETNRPNTADPTKLFMPTK